MRSTFDIQRPTWLTYIFFLSVTAAGLFHEYTAYAVSIMLAVLICIRCVKNKKLDIYINPIGIAVLVLVLFYGLSIIWALDRGMAVFGFFKFLPVLLFLILLMQKDGTAETVKFYLPYFAAVITLITSVGMQIPALKPLLSVQGRLAGTFQYPNTFALFLLVSLVLVVSKDRLKIIDAVTAAVLLFGIFYSGSRIVFALTVVSAVAVVFITKSKTVRLLLPMGMGAAVLVILIYTVITGETGIFGRFLTSFTESGTLNVRLLYDVDMLPVILRHPFGLGYMGYFYVQQSVQTGIYSVMYAHNELFQFMLDVGWVPALMFYGAVIRVIFKKNTPSFERLILSVILLHSLMDFDFQFIAVMFLVMLFCDFDSGKKITLTNLSVKSIAAGFAASAVSLYLGTVSILYYAGLSEQCHRLYPFHTPNEVNRLTAANSASQMADIASDILSRNEYVTIAYSALARASYSAGDFGSVINYKNKIFEISPFLYEEYEEYCYMLIQGISLYSKAGDSASVRICENELISARQKVESLDDRLSFFAKRIKDQPTSVLPDDINEYIDRLSR